MSSDQQQQPSLIGGHAQYVKGAAEVHPSPFFPLSLLPPLLPFYTQPLLIITPPQSAIGAVTGSETWNVSASADKASGIDAMKAASEQRDAQRDGYGKVEELAGKAAGCEGMEKEGAESKQQQ